MNVLVSDEVRWLVKRFREKKDGPEAFEIGFKIAEKLAAAIEPQERQKALEDACEAKLCPSCKIDWHETEGVVGRCRACEPGPRGCQEGCPCETARRAYREARR